MQCISQIMQVQCNVTGFDTCLKCWRYTQRHVGEIGIAYIYAIIGTSKHTCRPPQFSGQSGCRVAVLSRSSQRSQQHHSASESRVSAAGQHVAESGL